MFHLLEDNVGVVRLKHKRWSQSDGSLATSSSVNSELPQLRQELVSPGSRVTVHCTECSSTSRILQILRKLILELCQPCEKCVSRLKSVLEKIVSLDGLQHRVKQQKLQTRKAKISSNCCIEACVFKVSSQAYCEYLARITNPGVEYSPGLLGFEFWFVVETSCQHFLTECYYIWSLFKIKPLMTPHPYNCYDFNFSFWFQF